MIAVAIIVMSKPLDVFTRGDALFFNLSPFPFAAEATGSEVHML